MAKKINQPFFMRFVEKQDDVNTGVKAGAEGGDKKSTIISDKGYETMKYPSDGDDDPWGGWDY